MSDGEEEHHEEENFEAEDQIVGLPLTKGFFDFHKNCKIIQNCRFTCEGSKSPGTCRKWK